MNRVNLTLMLAGLAIVVLSSLYWIASFALAVEWWLR